MDFVEILQIIMAVASILFGVASLARPQVVAAAVGFVLPQAQGVSEIRINWGGVYIGLGIGAIVLGTLNDMPGAYQVFGFGYAGASLVRVIEVVLNRSLISRTFLIILGFEVVSAIVFLLP